MRPVYGSASCRSRSRTSSFDRDRQCRALSDWLPPTLDAPAECLKSADGGAVQLQTKFAASSVLPTPVQCASAGYGQTLPPWSRKAAKFGLSDAMRVPLAPQCPFRTADCFVGQRAKVPAGIEVDPVARLRNRDREWHRATESAQIGKPRSSRLDGRRIRGESPGLSAKPRVRDLPAVTAAASGAL